MSQPFQFSLGGMLGITTVAAITVWLATLGGTGAIVTLPVVVAALWGISRKPLEGVWGCAFFLVTVTWLIFVLAAATRRW